MRHTRKSLALIAILALSVSGCALLGQAQKVRHVIVISAVTAESTLGAMQDTEALIVCGSATALPAPKCVTAAQHVDVNKKFVTAFGLSAQVGRTLKATPAGTPTAADLLNLVAQIQVLVDEIWTLLPKSAPQVQTLQTNLGGTK